MYRHLTGNARLDDSSGDDSGQCRQFAVARLSAGGGGVPRRRLPEPCALLPLYGDLKILSEQHILDRNSGCQATARVRAKACGIPANVEGPERVQNAENRRIWVHQSPMRVLASLFFSVNDTRK